MMPAKPRGTFRGLVTSSQVSLPRIGDRCCPPARITGPLPGISLLLRVRTHAPLGTLERSEKHRSMTGIAWAAKMLVHKEALSAGR